MSAVLKAFKNLTQRRKGHKGKTESFKEKTGQCSLCVKKYLEDLIYAKEEKEF